MDSQILQNVLSAPCYLVENNNGVHSNSTYYNYIIYLIPERLDDSWVIVTNEESHYVFHDNDICGEIDNGWNAKSVYVSCLSYTPNNDNPKRGRYVRIQRKSAATYQKHRLSFCEVEVMSCKSGKWGHNIQGIDDCSLTCGYCQDVKCRVADGYCFDRCDPGWWGFREANVGDCIKQCGRCRNRPCWITTGQCPDGCQNGWWGHARGNDGDCMQQCSTACIDNVCHRNTGECLRGCVTGFWGPMCDKQCHCLHGTACVQSSGYCPQGCVEGYWGTTTNCKPCTCNPGLKCDSTTGTCMDGTVDIQTDPPAGPTPPPVPIVSDPTSTIDTRGSIITTSTTTTIKPNPNAQEVKEDGGGDDVGMIAGFTVALLILVFIILIIAFFFLR